MALTYDDIHKLVREPSSKVRAEIAQKVAASYNYSTFTPKANKIAVDIFRLLLKDTAVHVRKVLAEELKHNVNAPHDIIKALANDDFDVAEEILLHSKVLQESDLLEIINLNEDSKKLISIAQRNKVSERVSAALVNTKRANVVQQLLENEKADISETSYSFIVEEFKDEQSILESLVCRGDLSFTLAETLYTLVSDRLKKQMTRRHLLPRGVIEKATTNVREAAILKFLSPWMSDEDIISLVDQMYARKRLTDSIIVRSLCLGEIAFFEAAMAKRVAIPLSNARKLLADPGDAGFCALYRSSKLPVKYREAIKIMLKVVREEVKRSKEQHDEKDFNTRVIEQIKRNNYDQSVLGMDQFVLFLQKPMEGAFLAQ